MTVRWRLLTLGVQLAVLLLAAWSVTGTPYPSQNWFLAGLLAIAINPQLWEPFYPRPADIIGNGLIFLFIYATKTATVTQPAWNAAAAAVALAIALAIVALVFGFQDSSFGAIGRAARLVSQVASAKVIYSCVFVLSAVEWRPVSDPGFWRLLASGVLILIIAAVNWEAVWSTATGRAAPCTVEGSLGPSVLLVSAPQLPRAGALVSLSSAALSAKGVVLNRIRRREDDWGEIHLLDVEDWERLISKPPAKIEVLAEGMPEFVGSVDVGSTDRLLRFVATRPLEVGRVVATSGPVPATRVLYQLTSARIERSDVKGGSHLLVRAEATQLGGFDAGTLRLQRNRWVPTPGASVFEVSQAAGKDLPAAPASWVLVGHVIGTDVPVYMDVNAACEGHLAILGMTKMGKTCLAVRVAKALAVSRRVAILDQTGEYVSRRNFPAVSKSTNWAAPGLVVFEPETGKVPADRALEFLQFVLKQATEEYKASTPFPRVFIMDEAHQFVPEPAGLSFGVAGRDSSIAIGLLMMQVRKYGISIFLISQRTAVVAKSALSQCENLIAFRSVDQTGLDYLEAIAGPDVRALLPQLRQGEALVFGPAISSDSPVVVRVVLEDAA